MIIEGKPDPTWGQRLEILDQVEEVEDLHIDMKERIAEIRRQVNQAKRTQWMRRSHMSKDIMRMDALQGTYQSMSMTEYGSRNIISNQCKETKSIFYFTFLYRDDRQMEQDPYFCCCFYCLSTSLHFPGHVFQWREETSTT